ncbi:MAG TPA: excinuclease ABC subunit UvrA [Verrucomicrobiota bacterium]|nr:excinuclease ABC subunit UvrA [Verrucomicrobiota bacterium]HNU52995.1 excinuclease ABC subunit UvrA [Verrucomicrobiota bacterium]
MAKAFIRIGGARVHNLKNLTLDLPRDRLVVITGPSGSGKSSLAFDTLFAEGQRKYMESLSAYARQFLDLMEKPEVDFIEGLSPAIAIEQRTAGANPRSLIATTTEIYDYLRLLFAHVGQPHCPVTGQLITSQTTSEIVDRILALPARSRVMLLAPVVRNQRGEFRDVIQRMGREGFVRARIDGEIVELAGNVRVELEPRQRHTIEVVVDRLVIEPAVRTRLADSAQTALKWGEGRMLVLHQAPGAGAQAPWAETLHSNRMYSPATGASYDTPTPKHFSFNSPLGACPVCHGLGQKQVFAEDLVVPDPERTLEQGAILPWRRGGKRMVLYYRSLLRGLAEHCGANLQTPYRDLSPEFRKVLLHGSGEVEVQFTFWRAGKMSRVSRPFEGVIPNLQRLFRESESEFTRNRLKACMTLEPCDACRGRRLKPELLAVTLGTESPGPAAAPGVGEPAIPGLSIMGVCALSVEAADAFFAGLRLTPFQEQVAGEIIREIRARLGFLRDVGLGYLTLDRESGTLSGGEAQRIRLATQIGAGLVGVLYILDEPSIGLHQRDNERLLHTLEGLRDLGNSVVVVEHDEETIRRADHIVDLGPGAGVNGGELVAAGTLEDVMANPQSLTGRYLRGALTIPVPPRRVPAGGQGWLTVLGARANNLKDVTVRVPLGTLTCVTGVSGSGKSTLVDDIVRKGLARRLYGATERPGEHAALLGIESLGKMIVIDQTPIGRTPRSNPATYTGMFNQIRDLFARLPAARVRGYEAGRFSFNVRGGRCEKCEGDGVIKIEMNFLPPVYVTCEACGGRRYNRETLEVTYKGLNIADVLELTVTEAVAFFRAVPQIHDACETLAEVGLGYLRLGQAATTLSGGEAQRLKLAAELGRRAAGPTLYLLDEPTTGLHFHDVAKLLEVLFKLRDAGNTLVVIEHNLDVVKSADWIIDLGPEGGMRGGEVVVDGTPERVAECSASHTGQYLKRMLAR